jgi:hypothetical protein
VWTGYEAGVGKTKCVGDVDGGVACIKEFYRFYDLLSNM